jgi:hypothetical protein
MFNKSFFAANYFAPRYFPPVPIVVKPVQPGGGRGKGWYAQVQKLVDMQNITAVIGVSVEFEAKLKTYVGTHADVGVASDHDSSLQDKNAGKRAQQQLLIAALMKSIDI